jgi:acyl-CoA thioesterase-2
LQKLGDFLQYSSLRGMNFEGESSMSMSGPLEELVNLLNVEAVANNVFMGQSQDIGFAAVFGGQVLGQALHAALKTVEEGRPPHSLHSYFLRPGNAGLPIRYEVARIRDGKSFTTRQIIAYQREEPIFQMSASFARLENGLEHQPFMPLVLPPDQVPSNQELAQSFRDRIPTRLREHFTSEPALERRTLNPIDPFHPEKTEPIHLYWLKTTGRLSDDMSLHFAILAYTSDYGPLSTTLRPHGVSVFSDRLQAATLDHSIWFHRPFRVDEWLLYTLESPTASAARGFARGQIFSQDGRLIASVAQEGLIREL